MTEDNSNQELAEQETKPRVELPGERLRLAREESHLGRDEVAQHLRLDVKLIVALEENDYDKLPSPSYICGYLRSYAHLLKLPEEEVVHAYSQGEVISSALLPENVDIVSRKQPASSSAWPVIILLIVLGLLLAGLMMFDVFNTQGKGAGSRDAINGTTEQVVRDMSQQSEVVPLFNLKDAANLSDDPKNVIASEPEQITEFKKKNIVEEDKVEAKHNSTNIKRSMTGLRLTYNSDSWTEIVDATGARLIYRLVAKGNDISVDGVPPFIILLGNAPAVTVLFNGKEFNHKRYHRDNIAYFRISAAQ